MCTWPSPRITLLGRPRCSSSQRTWPLRLSRPSCCGPMAAGQTAAGVVAGRGSTSSSSTTPVRGAALPRLPAVLSVAETSIRRRARLDGGEDSESDDDGGGGRGGHSRKRCRSAGAHLRAFSSAAVAAELVSSALPVQPTPVTTIAERRLKLFAPIFNANYKKMSDGWNKTAICVSPDCVDVVSAYLTV